MKVKRIDLDDEEIPERVLVELSHDEAVYVALLIGKQTGTDSENIIPGGAEFGSSVYYGLTGGVFNRFYDDGVNDAAEATRRRAS
jgi:hypothetical protein